MEQTLQELCTVEGVLGSLIASEEGIVIARQFDTNKDPEKVGALVSSVLLSIRRAANEMEIGGFQNFLLETERSLLLASRTAAGLLVVLAVRHANPGLIRVEMELAAERLRLNARPVE